MKKLPEVLWVYLKTFCTFVIIITFLILLLKCFILMNF